MIGLEYDNRRTYFILDQGDENSMEKHFNEAKCYITLDQNGNAKNKEDSKENENPITVSTLLCNFILVSNLFNY